MIIDEHLLILILALLLDRIIGDPDWLWQRLPHPVVLFGKAISFFDRHFNAVHLPDLTRRRNGVMSIVALLFGAAVAGWAVHGLFAFFGWFGILVEAGLVAIFLAQKSLADHVGEVSSALRSEGLKAVAARCRASSAGIRRPWMNRAFAAPRSKALRRISPMALSRRRSGMAFSACRACSFTRC